MDGYRVLLNKKTHNICWRGEDTGKTTLVARNDKEGILAIHISGKMCWDGVGMPQTYTSTRFQVHRFESKGMVDEHNEDLILFDLWGLLEFPARVKREKKDVN